MGSAPVYDVALAEVDGLGPRRRRDLLTRYGSAQAVLEAPLSDLRTVPGIGPTLGKAVAAADVERALRTVEKMRALGGLVLTPGDARFPDLLREIPDPPSVLYVRGSVEALSQPSVAIVGSRNHTVYGAQVTEWLAARAAQRDLAIVSGMARGIDAVAHRASLGAAGMTVAVLGTGVDVVYPRENARLFEDLLRIGCVVSELPPRARARQGGFQARNRLISGLSLVLVVVEAGPRSGTSITAGCAADQGRTVLAVPGPILGSASWGTNRLIRDGAKPLLDLQDLWEEFPHLSRDPATTREPQEPLTDEERVVWNVLDAAYQPIDEVVARTGLGVAQVLSLLSLMEMRGLIRAGPGKQFARAL